MSALRWIVRNQLQDNNKRQIQFAGFVYFLVKSSLPCAFASWRLCVEKATLLQKHSKVSKHGTVCIVHPVFVAVHPIRVHSPRWRWRSGSVVKMIAFRA